MSYSTNITLTHGPRDEIPCLDHERIKLSGLDEVFSKYVIPVVVAIGMFLHVAFWLFSLLRPMPPLSLYKRLLLVLSCMDFLQLTSHILEASRFVAYDISHWFFRDDPLMYYAAVFPFILRTISSFTGMLTIIWICINCNHDIYSDSSSVTGDFLNGLGDGRCFKSLAMIFVISICLTTILQIQKRVIRGPACFRNKEDEDVMVRYWKNHELYGFLSELIETLIYVAFLAFLVIEIVVLVKRLRRQLAKAASSSFSSSSSSQGNREVRELLNEQSNTRNSSPNESHQAACYVVLPMCVYYILCWTPKKFVDLVNILTHRLNGEGQIKGYLAIWLLSTILLLNSIIDPITFLRASWKYHRGIAPGMNSTVKSRRETQETNV